MTQQKELTPKEIDDRHRRSILSSLTHPRLFGRPLELLSELTNLLATGQIKCGDCDRVVHRAKLEGLESAVDLARFQAKAIQGKREQRNRKSE